MPGQFVYGGGFQVLLSSHKIPQSIGKRWHSKSVVPHGTVGSNPILSANGTLENPVFSRAFSIRQKKSDFDFLCFCRFSEPILCSFSPVNIRIKNRQIPREIRLFKACILFAALERFPSDKKSPNFKTPGCGQPHQKSCVVFTG